MNAMNTDYERVEQAIRYLSDRAAEQPSLEDVAAHVHLSPHHFQRLFSRWAGTSPKRFLQVLTVEHGKRLLEHGTPLADVAHEVGLSGNSRLHDHFVTLEAVTPGEFRSQGKDLSIRYGSHDTPFGDMFVAITDRGICRAAFTEFSAVDDELDKLRQTWPLATMERDNSDTRHVVDTMFDTAGREQTPLSLHVAGTNFQLAVWRALLAIPSGEVSSYSGIATALNKPRASRAVGTAVGANPIAFLIPCHRVIRQNGGLGGYRWGTSRKRAMLAWEQAQRL